MEEGEKLYIHLGGDKIIRAKELVAIFDLSIENSSKISHNFVNQALERSVIKKIGDEEPKSLIVAKDEMYYSPISSATLKKRAHEFSVF